MANDIFIRAATQLAGAFSADQGRLSFGGGISTALVQNVNASYMQNVTRLYEVGNAPNQCMANVYYVGGRSQGQMSIARVIGPSILLSAYYCKFGNVCQAQTNTIQLTFNPLACNGGWAAYTCNYCVITQVGISVAAQDMIVNESSQLMFSGMLYEERNSQGATVQDPNCVSPCFVGPIQQGGSAGGPTGVGGVGGAIGAIGAAAGGLLPGVGGLGGVSPAGGSVPEAGGAGALGASVAGASIANTVNALLTQGGLSPDQAQQIANEISAAFAGLGPVSGGASTPGQYGPFYVDSSGQVHFNPYAGNYNPYAPAVQAPPEMAGAIP